MPTKDFRQTLTPDHFNGKRLEDNIMNVLEVKVFKEITVIRYLLSKLFFIEEKFSLEESVVLFVAFEKLNLKMASDQALKSKYGNEIFMFRSVFQSLESMVGIDPKIRLEKLHKVYYGVFHKGHKFLSKRNYFSIRGQIQKFFKARILTRFPKVIPPKAYIAKGYGDQGTAKNPAADGSPSWQEVAMSTNEDNLDSMSRSDREIYHFETLRVHHLQLITFNGKQGKLRTTT